MIKIIRLINTFLKRKFVRYFIPALWILLISYISFADFSGIDEKSIKIPQFDKIVHFLMYFSLTYILIVSRIFRLKHYKIFAVCFGILLGIIAELLQHFIFTYRTGDIMDFIFNSIGIFTSFLFYNKLEKVID
jgi:VanZ family protein